MPPMGGFDTHGRQIPPEGTILTDGHADLLKYLSNTFKALMDDLKAMGIDDKVVTWSPEEVEAYDYAGMRETEEKLRLAKAIKDKQLKIAKQMKDKGMDNKTIADLTDLSEDEVSDI